jgi:hypothetical protein
MALSPRHRDSEHDVGRNVGRFPCIQKSKHAGTGLLPTDLEILHSRANELARPAQFFQR